jgi:hypothetical protein
MNAGIFSLYNLIHSKANSSAVCSKMASFREATQSRIDGKATVQSGDELSPDT